MFLCVCTSGCFVLIVMWEFVVSGNYYFCESKMYVFLKISSRIKLQTVYYSENDAIATLLRSTTYVMTNSASSNWCIYNSIKIYQHQPLCWYRYYRHVTSCVLCVGHNLISSQIQFCILHACSASNQLN